jgi:ribosomal protein L37AE/L43A
MFTCPNCGSGLTRTPEKAGIFWDCPGCGGRAVGVALWAIWRKIELPPVAVAAKAEN